MNLLAFIAALAWERYQPSLPEAPREQAGRWLAWLQAHVNAGGEQHGLLAWSLGVAAPAVCIGVFALALHGVWSVLGWLFEVAVLYFCLGFKSASYQAASVAHALAAGDLARARATFLIWRPHLRAVFEAAPEAGGEQAEDDARVSAASLCTLTTIEVVRQSVTRLFGVLFWFVLLSAPGAAAYVLAKLAGRRWREVPEFGRFAARAAEVMDWLPVRLTAFSFAIVGNFQDALEAWREAAGCVMAGTPGRDDRLLLASAAGALGQNPEDWQDAAIRPDACVSGPGKSSAHAQSEDPDESSGAPGQCPAARAVDAAAALVWRALLLWVTAMLLFLLGGL